MNLLREMINWIIENGTFVALVINIITLTIVYFQTRYTKRSLIVSEENLAMIVKADYLIKLERMNPIIEVNVSLKMWHDNLEEFKKLLNNSDKRKLIQSISEKGLNSPKGLINKIFYDSYPYWLRNIQMAGVQYYFQAKQSAFLLKNYESNEEVIDRVIKIFSEQVNTSIRCIDRLSSLLKDSIPEEILYAPAAIDENKFM